MKNDRNIKDVINDLDLILREISKLDEIRRLINIRNWYNNETFIDMLQDILDGEETDD